MKKIIKYWGAGVLSILLVTFGAWRNSKPQQPPKPMYEWQATYKYSDEQTTIRVGTSDKNECPFILKKAYRPNEALVDGTCKTRIKE